MSAGRVQSVALRIISERELEIEKFDPEEYWSVQGNFLNKDKHVIYKLNPNLLKNILKGPKYAHWNNAEIGSHIRFYRNPNVFDRKLYLSMSYFHA